MSENLAADHILLSTQPAWMNAAQQLRDRHPYPINALNPGESLIHLGIAHTGNNTQRDAFKNAIPNSQWHSFNIWNDVRQRLSVFAEKNAADQKSVKVFHIHALCPIHREIRHKTRYVSFLRDPKHMFLSRTFNYYRNTRGLSIDGITRKEINETVLDSIKLHEDWHGDRFLMTAMWFLCFDDGTWNNIAADVPNYKKYESMSDADLVNRCSSNIKKHFPFIGITEYFSESIFIICSLFGLDRIPLFEIKHQFSAPGPDNLDADVLKELERLLRVDMALYEDQKNNFEKTFSEYLAAFDQTIGSLNIYDKG